MKQPNPLGILLLFAILIPAVAFAGTSGPSPIPNAPSFQVSTNTLLLCRGVVNQVPITISNLGQANGSITMESIQLGITSNKYLVAVQNGITSTLTLPPRTTATAIMPIFANPGNSTLVSVGLSIDYDYLNYYSDSEVRNISFGIESCPSPLSLSISPKVITSGHIGNITVNLTNSGATALNSISIHLSLPAVDGQILSAQPIYVNSIPPMNTVLIKEAIFVSKNASQAFPINLTASLYNGTSPVQVSLNPILLSSGIVNISASSITVSPLNPSPGGIFSLSFVLTDIGTGSVSALTLTSPPTKGFSTFGSNSVFVGDMQVDSQTPATITLIANGSLKPGTYYIPIKINYLNNLRENLSSTIVVPVSLTESNALNSTGSRSVRTRGSSGGLVTVILVVLVILFAYLFYRERKRRPK